MKQYYLNAKADKFPFNAHQNFYEYHYFGEF